MENVILKLVLLWELYECCLPKELVSYLFGEQTVKTFENRHSGLSLVDGYFGRCNVEEYKKKEKTSSEKLERAKVMLKYLKYIPWVKFAAISGSVAFSSASENDDIDVYIVTNEKRLWLVRVMELVIFRVLGSRRKFGEKNVKDKLCFVYYVSEDSLEISVDKEDKFFTALELVMLKSVYKTSYFGNVLSENRWIKEYFPNVDILRSDGVVGKTRVFLFSGLLDLLDLLFMKLQLGYMKIRKRPRDGVYLSRNCIRFFPPAKWLQNKKKGLREALKRYDIC